MSFGELYTEGNTAAIYLKENSIIKVFKAFLPETESANEAAKQAYAFSQGLHVPQILDVTKIDGKQAIVMEYIEGATLGRLLEDHPEQFDYYLTRSIDIQQHIHRTEAAPLEQMPVKLRRQIEDAPFLEPELKSRLLKRMDSIRYEAKLCHGDFHLFNLILSGNQTFIIDWVDASNGDIRADVCRTYLLYSHPFPELARRYLQLYCSRSSFTKEEILQWLPILAGARFSEHVSGEETGHLLQLAALG